MNEYLLAFWTAVALGAKAVIGVSCLFFVLSLFAGPTAAGFGIIFLLLFGGAGVAVLFEAKMRCRTYQDRADKTPEPRVFAKSRRSYVMPKNRRRS